VFLTANMPRLRLKDKDLEYDITKHKVKKTAPCPDCGAYCYYPNNGDAVLVCSGVGCGKTWKEEMFLKGD